MAFADEPLSTLYVESEERIRGRLLKAIPDTYSKVEGAWARDMAEISVTEFTSLWQEVNSFAERMFIRYARGQFLDAHADNYGIERGAGTKAAGTVRFTAPPGTVIPTASIVSVPVPDEDQERARYVTTNLQSVTVGVAGYADVIVEAVDVGAHTNVAAGSITVLETPLSGPVTALTNLAPVGGGSDPETDDSLRAKLALEARYPSGAGSTIDHELWAKEIPGVEEAAVQGLWDTSAITPGTGSPNGTVLTSIRGAQHQPVDWQTLEAVQRHVDPSRQVLALMESGEGWTVVASAAVLGWVISTKQMGYSSLQLTIPARSMSPPVLTATGFATGGSLPAGIYLHQVTARNANGETLASNQSSTTVAGTTSRIDLSWPAVVGAVTYDVYRGTETGDDPVLLTSVATNAYSNTGAVVPGTRALPTVDGTRPLVGVDRAMDLSRFVTDDEVYLWLKADNWANVASATRLRFHTTAGDYYDVALSSASTGGSLKPTTGSAWWLFRVQKSAFAAVGIPSWASITRLALRFETIAAAVVQADYYSIRAIGRTRPGRAPIGARVTVVTPVPRVIDVTITGLVLESGYSLGGSIGTADVAAVIRENLTLYLQSLPPGDPVRLVDVSNSVHDSLGVLDFVLAAPAGNVAITPQEYPTLGTLLIS